MKIIEFTEYKKILRIRIYEDNKIIEEVYDTSVDLDKHKTKLLFKNLREIYKKKFNVNESIETNEKLNLLEVKLKEMEEGRKK